MSYYSNVWKEEFVLHGIQFPELITGEFHSISPHDMVKYEVMAHKTIYLGLVPYDIYNVSELDIAAAFSVVFLSPDKRRLRRKTRK